MGRLKADKVLTTPAYPLIEAAHYLKLPLSTLRAWCLGQPLRADAKTRRFEPLIRLNGDQRRALSFLNLVEAHILAAIRRKHHIPLAVVRRALDYIAKQLRSARPLAEMQFQTDGVDLIVDRLGTLINGTREGQTEMADVLRQHLKRIERNAEGTSVRLFPFTRTDERSRQPAPVVSIRALPSGVWFSPGVRYQPRFSPIASRRETVSSNWPETMARPRRRSRKRSAASSTAKRLESAVFYLDESIDARVLDEAASWTRAVPGVVIAS